ncbi:septal ring lytic transglycosylase RlpA family protein [Sabulibacter ruber]|uniref:septal ring lytic transglycosylase RlpA family protein n=1 Tax=Sabulibacter ruber TaxID=2811901 RepID=UPI001A973B44|nr:septal ring lytic transglycosylase RlpA family protein [Sabulibacter ruber]
MRKSLLCLLLCLLQGISFASKSRLTGTATFYAKAHIGHRTTSGERYNPNELTAAHATLPINSYVQVHNLKNGRTVLVRINDRMSRNSRYVIDVSRKAAQTLGIIGAGMGKVKLVVVSKEEALAQIKKVDKAA